MIVFFCMHCGTRLQRPDGQESQPSVCEQCGQRLQVPAAKRSEEGAFDAGAFLLQGEPPLSKTTPQSDAPPVLKFSCPHCQAVIRSDASKAGMRVKCSKCSLPCEVPLPRGHLLDTPASSPDVVTAATRPPERLGPGPSRARNREEFDGRQVAVDSVNAPAIMLMVYSFVYAVFALAGSYRAYEIGEFGVRDPYGMEIGDPDTKPSPSDTPEQRLEKEARRTTAKREQEDRMRYIRKESLWSLLFGAVGAVFSVIIATGALAMKRLRSYGMAMAGAVLALLPCLAACSCGMGLALDQPARSDRGPTIMLVSSLVSLVGAPLGLWALIVINRSQVKAAFGRGD